MRPVPLCRGLQQLLDTSKGAPGPRGQRKGAASTRILPCRAGPSSRCCCLEQPAATLALCRDTFVLPRTRAAGSLAHSGPVRRQGEKWSLKGPVGIEPEPGALVRSLLGRAPPGGGVAPSALQACLEGSGRSGLLCCPHLGRSPAQHRKVPRESPTQPARPSPTPCDSQQLPNRARATSGSGASQDSSEARGAGRQGLGTVSTGTALVRAGAGASLGAWHLLPV